MKWTKCPPSFWSVSIPCSLCTSSPCLWLTQEKKKILWSILWPSFYSFVSMTMPSWSSGTRNFVSPSCRNLIRTKFWSWFHLFSNSIINSIMWVKLLLANTAKVNFEGNLSASLTLLGLRFSFMDTYQAKLCSQWECSNLVWDTGMELVWLPGMECSGLAVWSQRSRNFSLDHPPKFHEYQQF